MVSLALAQGCRRLRCRRYLRRGPSARSGPAVHSGGGPGRRTPCDRRWAPCRSQAGLVDQVGTARGLAAQEALALRRRHRARHRQPYLALAGRHVPGARRGPAGDDLARFLSPEQCRSRIPRPSSQAFRAESGRHEAEAGPTGTGARRSLHPCPRHPAASPRRPPVPGLHGLETGPTGARVLRKRRHPLPRPSGPSRRRRRRQASRLLARSEHGPVAYAACGRTRLGGRAAASHTGRVAARRAPRRGGVAERRGEQSRPAAPGRNGQRPGRALSHKHSGKRDGA